MHQFWQFKDASSQKMASVFFSCHLYRVCQALPALNKCVEDDTKSRHSLKSYVTNRWTEKQKYIT